MIFADNIEPKLYGVYDLISNIVKNSQPYFFNFLVWGAGVVYGGVPPRHITLKTHLQAVR